MTDSPLTPEQRADLMRKAGIPDDVIAVAEPTTAIPLIHEEPDDAEQGELFTSAAVVDVITSTQVIEAKPVKPKKSKRAKQTASTDDLDAIAQALCERAKGDKGKALTLVDEHVQAWFDERKLSTKQAAAQGIERSEHNVPLWAAAQDMRSTLKARVRKHFAESGGFVKAKVKAHVPTSLAEQFLTAQGVQDPNVGAFLDAFTKFINAQKEGS